MRATTCTLPTIVVAALLCIPATSHAQWLESGYSVDSVLSSIGNYTYSAGSSGGDVDAITPTSPAPSSTIKVQFVQKYDAPPGTPALTITPTGHLTGSQSGGGGTATSRVSDTIGQDQLESYDSTVANPYDVVRTLSSYTVSAPETPAYIIGTAIVALPYTGSSHAHSTVYFNP